MKDQIILRSVQCFLLISRSLSFSPTYSLEMFGDQQRACFHVVQGTSPVVFPGALGVLRSLLGIRVWALSPWAPSVPPPKKKYCFLSFLHIGLLGKMYWREGSTLHLNFKHQCQKTMKTLATWSERRNGFIGPQACLASWQKRPFEGLWVLWCLHLWC